MKILIASARYLPAVGGLEKAVHNIAVEFRRSGHEVSVVTNRHKRTLSGTDEFEGIKVRRYFFTTTPPPSWNPWVWIKYAVRLLIGPYSFFSLLLKIKNKKPDVVHLHFVGSIAFYILFVRQFIRFPLVVSIHGSDVERYEEKTWIEKRILKLALKTADFVTSNSKHLLQEALAKTNLKSLRHCGVVPMAFSAERYSDIESFRHSKPYIFSAGRFVYKKGLDVLLKAYAIVLQGGTYSGDLIIAGDGEEFSKYQQLAKKLQIQDRVIFYGLANWAQMVSLLKGCEFFVIPSRLEAFGIVLLEALYAGKKVIASNVGGLVELMTDNPDFLTEAENVEMLAEKMEGLLSGKLVWHEINKQQLKQRYSWKRVTHSYLRIYARLIAMYMAMPLALDTLSSLLS